MLRSGLRSVQEEGARRDHRILAAPSSIRRLKPRQNKIALKAKHFELLLWRRESRAKVGAEMPHMVECGIEDMENLDEGNPVYGNILSQIKRKERSD